jgi:hypothetical protein
MCIAQRRLPLPQTHLDNTALCETTDIGNCYAHTEAGLSSGYECVITYQGMTDGQAQAACACKIIQDP